nr:unnamed protein product [Callosobruchus analis]
MKQVHKQPISMNSEENKRKRAEYVTALNIDILNWANKLYGLMKQISICFAVEHEVGPELLCELFNTYQLKGSQCTPNRCNISSRGCDNGTSQRLFFIGFC